MAIKVHEFTCALNRWVNYKASSLIHDNYKGKSSFLFNFTIYNEQEY